MNNTNFHPEQKVPPLAHALHKWNEENRMLSYEYNGIDIISVQLPESKETGFRHGSDGTIQSIAYMQQIYITVDHPTWVTLRFTLSKDTVNMKPHRAGTEEGIIGQAGNILIHGVNGLYDINQDLLIDINGCEWYWEQKRFEIENDKRVAFMKVCIGPDPLYINLKMHYYRNHLGYRYHEPWNHKPKDKAVSGWCSWEAFRRDISIEKINKISEFMSEKLKAYGLEYIQVDDGYQKMPLPYYPEKSMADGWFTCEEERFPGGHDQIVKQIKSYGFSPAIWTNANITNEKFPEKNPDAVIFHNGKPLKGEWIDFLYNCTEETLEKHVTPTFERFSDTGYQYVKIDAIRHLLFDGLHEAVRLGIMTNEEAESKFRGYMEATKKGLKDDVYYLASWGEMHEVVGLADACRISMDANPTWPGIRMQLFEMARWYHSQRILFLNDPDHVCIRTKTEWAKSVLSMISLSGGLYMLSDPMEAYTEEKLEVIRKTLPPLKTRTGETGPLSLDYPAYTWTKLHGFAVQSHETPVEMEDVSLDDAYHMAGKYPTMEADHPFSSLWSFHLEKAGYSWCVAGRFATVPLRNSCMKLSNIQLEPDTFYHAFDFWEQKYLGVVKNTMECRELAIGECQIIGLRKAADYPQFIASSRHVSMDAVSVIKEEQKDGELKLYIEGIEDTEENYYFILPDSYFLKNVECSGMECNFSIFENLVTVKVKFNCTNGMIKLVY